MATFGNQCGLQTMNCTDGGIDDRAYRIEPEQQLVAEFNHMGGKKRITTVTAMQANV